MSSGSRSTGEWAQRGQVYAVDMIYNVDKDAVRLATFGSAGVSMFVALVAVLHVVDPGRDPVSITVSEYVLGPHGWLLSFAGLSFGLGVLATTVAFAVRAKERTK
jgi:hypothetical protein